MSDVRPSVLYWNNMPTPYTVVRFNAVAERGTVLFRALFTHESEPDRSWVIDRAAWKFDSDVATDDVEESQVLGWVLRKVREISPDLFVCGYDRREFVLAALASLGLSRRTAVRCLPQMPGWTPPSRVREAALKLLFSSIDGAKVPGSDGAAFATRFGLPPERTWPVVQSLDVEHYGSSLQVDGAVRAASKVELGIGDGPSFVYVGRIWAGKGLDDLFAAYRVVRSRLPDCRLILVGNGVDEARYRGATAGLPDVVWAGFRQVAQMPSVYAVADVLVFPTKGDPNGLVVEEAAAAGVPVISSTAAGDIRARVEATCSGVVYEDGNVEQLVDAMCRLGSDAHLRAEMRANALERAERYRPDRYASTFDQFVQGVLAAPPRKGKGRVVGASVGRAVAMALR